MHRKGQKNICHEGNIKGQYFIIVDVLSNNFNINTKVLSGTVAYG
jgi:hypothetical protein